MKIGSLRRRQHFLCESPYHYPQGMENSNIPLLHTDENHFQVLDLVLCHPNGQAKVLYRGGLGQGDGHQVNSAHRLQPVFCLVTKESLQVVCSVKDKSLQLH